MLITPHDQDFFDRIRVRRAALEPYAGTPEIKSLLDKVDSIGSTWMTVNPDDLEQKALGPLEEAETLASKQGYKLPADYHKHSPSLLGPQGGTVSDLQDLAALGKDTVWGTAVSGCKETGTPAWICETRLPHVSEIPWWAWVGGAIVVGGGALYLYAAYKILPVALPIVAGVVAPELIPVMSMAKGMTPPTPAVHEALVQKAASKQQYGDNRLQNLPSGDRQAPTQQRVFVNGQRVA